MRSGIPRGLPAHALCAVRNLIRIESSALPSRLVTTIASGKPQGASAGRSGHMGRAGFRRHDGGVRHARQGIAIRKD